jgi:hypothetical protein
MQSRRSLVSIGLKRGRIYSISLAVRWNRTIRIWSTELCICYQVNLLSLQYFASKCNVWISFFRNRQQRYGRASAKYGTHVIIRFIEYLYANRSKLLFLNCFVFRTNFVSFQAFSIDARCQAVAIFSSITTFVHNMSKSDSVSMFCFIIIFTYSVTFWFLVAFWL